MLKLNLLTGLLLITLLTFSQIDTTTLKYPRIAYPGEIVKDTCIELTLEQGKKAVRDAINADSYKEETDSLKSVVTNQTKLIKQQMFEISQLNYDRNTRNEIIEGFSKESEKYKDWWKDSEVKLHLTKKVDKIVYPVLGGIILSAVLYIGISAAIN